MKKNIRKAGNGQNGIFTCALLQFIYLCLLQIGYQSMWQLEQFKAAILGFGSELSLVGLHLYCTYGLW